MLSGREARRSKTGGPPSIPRSERVRIGIALVAILLPSAIVALVPDATGFIDVTGRSSSIVLAMTLTSLAAASLVLLSGLIDWFYVRPHLRGGQGTICATSMHHRWRGVTRTWLMHRAAATLGVIAAITAIVTMAANSWVRPLDDVVAGAIAGVATIIAGYYITRTAPLLAIAVNPPVQVGDVIELAEEFNIHEPDKLREYFVVDVALEGVKLLRVDRDDCVRRTGLDARRTHDRTVDVAEIAKLLRGRRAIRPCDSCQRLSEHCGCAAAWEPAETSTNGSST